jgi:hypothetical protein
MPAPPGPDVGTTFTILVPLFNDWESLRALAAELDRVLAAHGLAAHLLVVDDGSPDPPPADALDVGRDGSPPAALRGVTVLELRRNLGHQRAIAVGLGYIEAERPDAPVVVMDCDGEDLPEDIPRLLEAYRAHGGERIVFAERAQRSESLSFRVFYRLYKLTYRLLTGRAVRFGNFSVIPPRRLRSLVVVSELWNHYVAAALKSRQPYCLVPTRRGHRLRGQSQMNFVSLIIHGLSAISVDSEVVGVRLLVVALALIPVALLALAVIVGIRLFTALAIPGWATTAAGVSVLVLGQAVLLATVFSFVTLSGRQGSSFLPRRDYVHYVGRVYALEAGPAHAATPSPTPSRHAEPCP